MATNQKVNGRNYGARGTKIEEEELTGSVVIERAALMKTLKENQALADEVKFLTAKLEQEKQINKTLKRMVLATEEKLEKFTKSANIIG